VSFPVTRRGFACFLLIVSFVLALGPSQARAAEAPPWLQATPTTPVQHVIIIFQENQSFDSVFGKFCQERNAAGVKRCDGVTAGKILNGTTLTLKSMPDIVPSVEHNGGGQISAINGGLMNGFERISGCSASTNYRCYTQLATTRIPNLVRLARSYAISDRTFELCTCSSWMAHNSLAIAGTDGFAVKPGFNPKPAPGFTSGLGWGCRSNKDADWVNPGTHLNERQPSCIPFFLNGQQIGPYRLSPVSPADTIMDRMDAGGVSWNIFTASDPNIWAICPTIAQCEFTGQKSKQLKSGAVITQANAGTLPDVSIVMPTAPNSQHNGQSIAMGDNWIGSVVSAAMNGPQKTSTAIFITYDDCGCFYDHVPPPAGSQMGIRVPMVIVSPYAKKAFTDSTPTSFAGMLAFIEHNWGLPPLTSADASAYDYRNAFDFSQTPLAPVKMTRTSIPLWERNYLKAHPGIEEEEPEDK
jgi:phospholipase C